MQGAACQEKAGHFPADFEPTFEVAITIGKTSAVD